MQEKPERHDIDIRFGQGRFDERVTSKLFDDAAVVLASPAYLSSRALEQPADPLDSARLQLPALQSGSGCGPSTAISDSAVSAKSRP